MCSRNKFIIQHNKSALDLHIIHVFILILLLCFKQPFLFTHASCYVQSSFQFYFSFSQLFICIHAFFLHIHAHILFVLSKLILQPSISSHPILFHVAWRACFTILIASRFVGVESLLFL